MPATPAKRSQGHVTAQSLVAASDDEEPSADAVRHAERLPNSPREGSGVAPRSVVRQAPLMVSEARLEPTEHGLVPTGDGWFVLNGREASWREGAGRGA